MECENFALSLLEWQPEWRATRKIQNTRIQTKTKHSDLQRLPLIALGLLSCFAYHLKFKNSCTLFIFVDKTKSKNLKLNDFLENAVRFRTEKQLHIRAEWCIVGRHLWCGFHNHFDVLTIFGCSLRSLQCVHSNESDNKFRIDERHF